MKFRPLFWCVSHCSLCTGITNCHVAPMKSWLTAKTNQIRHLTVVALEHHLKWMRLCLHGRPPIISHSVALIFIKTQFCNRLCTYSTFWPDMDYICNQTTMCIIQCILHWITTQIFSVGSWNTLEFYAQLLFSTQLLLLPSSLLIELSERLMAQISLKSQKVLFASNRWVSVDKKKESM